ncbi:hypothetical protein [Myroides sp. LJL115]
MLKIIMYKILQLAVSLCIISVLFIRCDKPEQESLSNSNFGNATSYDSFLWKEKRSDTLEKSFSYTFNNWAEESNSYVNIILEDQNKSPLTSQNGYHFIINDTKVENGKILLNSKDKSRDTLQFKLVITDPMLSDIYGYMSIDDNNLDRVNEFENPNNTTIYKWSAHHQKITNPLKVTILWILSILIGITLFYLLFIKPFVYKRFSKGQVTIQAPFYLNVNLRGKIEVIYSNVLIKQGFLKKLFTGNRQGYKNPFFTSPIHLTPGVKGKVRIRTAGHYTIEPFTSTLEKGKQYQLTNNETKEKITITYI